MNIKQLEIYFSKRELPKTIKLSDYANITNVPLMVSTHLSILKFNAGNKTFMPYFSRLMQLKVILDTKKT